MSHFKELFQNHTTEHLLAKRALGDELSDDAHAAIEDIFKERGESLPPKPTRPVLSTDITVAPSKKLATAKTIAILFLCLLAIGFAKVISHTWVGFAISGIAILYLLIYRPDTVSDEPEKQEEEVSRQIAKRDKLNPLMLASANGDLVRVQELISFGQDVNVQSLAGTTALMYAAGNGHLDVVDLLLQNGADPNILSEKKSTALLLAKKFGHEAVQNLLVNSGAHA